MNLERRKTAVAWLSVVSNTTLVVLKLIIGLLIGSVSVISEAIHSGVDLLAAMIALFAVKTADLPPDDEHPYGHGKIENLSGTIEALLIFLAAAWIIFEAVKKLQHHEPLDAPAFGVAVMFISAVANLFVSRMLFKVGKETDSVALQADAWHLRTDVWTSAGVMGGLACILLGQRLFPGVDLAWVDPVAAIGVALLIIKAAWDLTREAARDLMDVALPEAEAAWIRERIAARHDVRGMHRLRTRKSGSYRFVEFHIQVEAGMSVEESHDIGEAITREIEERYPRTTVTVHVEPCKLPCKPLCMEGCFRAEQERLPLGE